MKRTEKLLAKARARDSMFAFSKLTEEVDGKVRIVDQAPLIVPLHTLVGEEGSYDATLEGLRDLVRTYRESLGFDRQALLEQFELADFARKVVGVGSVGTRAWIALFLGRDGRDPLFLQMKEAEASVFEGLLGPSEFSNHGQRVVVGQRLMQASSDIFLGWLHVESGLDGRSRDFYGRQLKDWKGSAEIEQMIPKGMATYGKLCGWTLATGPCPLRRSGGDCRVSRRGQQLRPRHRRVLPGLRGAERPRLQGSDRGGRLGRDRG